jgi:hypothetical protein
MVDRADTDHADQESKEAENLRKWQVSRRRLLKIIGAAGATAVAAPFLPPVLGKIAPAEAKNAGNGVKTRRLRRWVREHG